MDTKIAIGISANMGLRPKTVQSLLELVQNKNYEVFIAKEGYNTAENRNLLAAQAVKAGCTHLFLADADMYYLPDTIDSLLKHDKDIIGATYHVRNDTDSDVVEYLEEKSETEPFPVAALGGGCLLIKTEVFKTLPQPHFWYELADNGMVKMSNDWWFCYKARENGYEVYCDPTVYPAHIGYKEY